MGYLSGWMLGVLALNLLIAVGALFGFRALQGLFAGVNVKEELAHKDNFAFGLSVAGGIAALCLVLSAAVSGEAAVSLVQEAINVLSFAVGGIVLLKLGVIINDKLFLRGFSLGEQLRAHNLAAGTVNAASLVAQGLIISAAVHWVEIETWQGIGAVGLVFLASQVVMFAVVQIRIGVYRRRHGGESWQAAIAGGNTALAVRYAGQIIATAFAVTAVSNLVNFLPAAIWMSVLAWLVYSMVMVLVIWGLYRLLRPVILPGVDVHEEVDNQKNIGIAFIEAATFIGIAVIVKVLMS
ncbi:MAG: DUF350 domain-containing protein [Exilibacterium sp.]